MRRPILWAVPRSIIISAVVCALMWACAGLAFGQEIPEPVVRHYQTQRHEVASNGVAVRIEFHLLIGYDRAASLVLGGEADALEPSYNGGVSGPLLLVEDRLCFTIDTVWGPNIPRTLIGELACYVYDKENDTMGPINDPDGLLMQRAPVPQPPNPERRQS